MNEIEVTVDAQERMAQNRQEHLEKQLYGGWRSGYDYLFDVWEIPADFQLSSRFISSNRRRYDLSRISHSDIQDSNIEHILTAE